jgi:hypothetical protein
MAEYKRLKDKNPSFNTFDFRVLQYGRFFLKNGCLNYPKLKRAQSMKTKLFYENTI